MIRRGKRIADRHHLLRARITVAQQHGFFRRRHAVGVVIGVTLIAGISGAIVEVSGYFAVSAAHADFEAGFRGAAGWRFSRGGAGARLTENGKGVVRRKGRLAERRHLRGG